METQSVKGPGRSACRGPNEQLAVGFACPGTELCGTRVWGAEQVRGAEQEMGTEQAWGVMAQW